MAFVFLAAAWRKLVMAQYEVDPSVLAEHLPRGVELDLFQGRCFVSLVGFLFDRVRIVGVPIPFHTQFEEVNLRFYVKRIMPDGSERRGVVFISEIVPKSAITVTAKMLYGERYRTAPMSHLWRQSADELDVSYSWQIPGARNRTWQHLGVLAGSQPACIEQGSIEEFITEHYWGYTNGSGLLRGRHVTGEYGVEHPRWQQYPVRSAHVAADFGALYGRGFASLAEREPDHTLLAEGSAIAVRHGSAMHTWHTRNYAIGYTGTMPRNSDARIKVDPEVWLRGLPKAELHLHLEGSITPETLVELSLRNDAQPLSLEAAKMVYNYTDFPSFLMSFKAVTERLHAPVDYETITYNMLRDLASQGIRHAEAYISVGILYRFARLDVDEVIAAIERGRARGEADFGISLLWIIDAVRHFGLEECQRVFAKAAELKQRYPSVVGVGIGGDELRGPAQDFRELYAEAKANGLRLTCHAGENTGPQSIWAAVNIGAERIGHALTAWQDEDLIAVLAERQIPLELNITSNLRTGCCPSLFDHPAKRYFEEGLMVTLNSDDPPFFGATLLDDFLLAHREFEFSFEQLRELAANSIEASFLPPERKLALLSEVERYGW